MTSFSFQLFLQDDTTCCSLNCVINMAEEFRKYKDILAREHKEFREQMERELSAFLPF